MHEGKMSSDGDGGLLQQQQLKKQLRCIGYRHILALLSFLGFVNVYAMRVNLSVALVEMINGTARIKNDTQSECPSPYGNSTDSTQEGEFDWDEDTQGAILSSFFYGYLVTQIPGGWLAERYGGKKLFGFGVLCTAIFTLLTPIAARLHVAAFIVVRVLEGLGEGVTFPAMHAVWAKWAPPLERSKLVSFTYSGSQLGTVLSLPVSSLLCKYGFAGGWPSVFYVFGALGCLWFVLWMWLVHDSPAEHPLISEAERNYIEGGLRAQHSFTSNKKVHKNLPLVALKSVPVWAITVTHFCYNWGFYTLLTCLPTYMKNILRYDITQNGYLSALPYLVMWFVIIIVGPVTDYIRQRGYLSTGAVRKIDNTTGLVLPGAFLIVTCYVGCDQTLAVVALTIGVAFGGFSQSGFNVNHLDIAPQFAGTLLGITNSAGTVSGILAPQVVGLLTNNQETLDRWKIVFYIAAGIYVFGALVFLIFASGEVQYWARDDYRPSGCAGDSPTERDPLVNVAEKSLSYT